MKYIVFIVILFFPCLLNAQDLPVYKAIQYDASKVEGYFFLTFRDNIIIIDKNANVVYYKTFHETVNDVFNFALVRNKRMVFSTSEKLYIMDSTFRLTDSFACKNSINFDHHDNIILPDGHLLLLGSEAIKLDLNHYPEYKNIWKKDTLTISEAVIQEQDVQTNVLFEWHAKDHFSLTDVDSFYVNRKNFPAWTHSNALAMDDDGNILLSSRNFCEITKINHKDGSIIWRFGGKHNEFKFVNCPVPFYGQHDIKKLPNGHYTLFDNGNNKISHGARAMEFELDEKNKVATLIWSYTFDKDMKSLARGSMQRLENGNTLINFGFVSCDSACFVVVNLKGEKILQMNGNPTYRVFNYPALPFQLHRPVISCFDSTGVKYLDAGAGYKTYKWNTGDSTRIIKASKCLVLK